MILQTLLRVVKPFPILNRKLKAFWKGTYQIVDFLLTRKQRRMRHLVTSWDKQLTGRMSMKPRLHRRTFMYPEFSLLSTSRKVATF